MNHSSIIKTSSLIITILTFLSSIHDSLQFQSNFERGKVKTVLFGNTSGACIKIEDGLLCRGDSDLIKNMNWTIFPNGRIGLVGPNGAGKSTLLSVIAGRTELEHGKLSMDRSIKLGYLEQKGVSGSTKTVFEEASSQMSEINSAFEDLNSVLELIAENPNEARLLDKLAKAQSNYESVGGNTQEKTVSTVLKGLSFKTSDFSRKCSEFSGGWQMRISLAKLLLSDADFLLLDEPTNHLDSSSKLWLGKYLMSYQGTIIVVSHDTDLLKSMALTEVAEVRNAALEVYKGCSYENFLEERVQRNKRSAALYEAEQKEKARLQSFVDRFGASAVRASAAQSRVKRIEKIERNGTAPPPSLKVGKAKLVLAPAPACHSNIVKLSDTSFGFQNGPVILNSVNLLIEKGMRLVIIGPNGSGKSTLLKAIEGKLGLSNGERVVGDGVSIGVFTQDLAQDLPQHEVALSLVLRLAREQDPTISDERGRAVMGALGLEGDKSLRPVGYLSGGEKARVALSVFALVPRNLLLLDEPSNHLDQQTLAALVAAVKSWKGTVGCVSHNRNFIESLKPTHTVVVHNGEVGFYNRPPEGKDWEFTTDFARVEADVSSEKREANLRRKRRLNAPSRIRKVEDRVSSLEQEIEKIDRKMIEFGTDLAKVTELSENKIKLQKDIEGLYEEWEHLESLLANEC